MSSITENLIGVDSEYGVFLFFFFSIMIVPYASYFYIKDFFDNYYSPVKSQTISILLCVGIIWIFIIGYIIYFFSEDFKSLFCNKNRKNKEIEEMNKIEHEKLNKMNKIKQN